MRTRTAVLAAVAVSFVTARPAVAQVERYELGQRVKRFEADWETADDAGRKRALKLLKPLTRQYLTFQYGEAGRTLDEARFALRAKPPTDAERWLASLAVVPEKRLVDAKTPELKVEVRAFYKVPVDLPTRTSTALHIGQGKPVDVPLGKLPVSVGVSFPLPGWQGDQLLWLEGMAEGEALAARTSQVSARHDLPGSVEAWKRLADAKPPEQKLEQLRGGIEYATVRSRAATLIDLANGDVPETSVPVDRWEIEALFCTWIGSFGGRYFTSDGKSSLRWAAPNQHTLTIPTGGGKLTPCRLLIPPKTGHLVPVVVALHGMGGSENLFFEGYGAGCVVKACEKRGWMLVCPRGGNGFLGGPPPVTEIIDKLAERYPIDKSRVFLMGHSMGAAQTVELAQAKPGAFATVAVLGGGGRVRTPQAFAGVPTFIGVGSEDFAKGGATGFHKTLTDAGVRTVTYKEYPDVEHTVIVRVAVDDVFAAFDKAKP